MSTQNELLKQIEALVQNNTFSLDALDGIKQIKDGYSKSLSEIEFLRERIKDLDKLAADTQGQLAEAQATIEKLNKKILEQTETEIKGKEAIYEARASNAVAMAWREAMQTVFKPNTVRETVFQSIPISQTYGTSAPMVNQYQQETKTTKEEL